MRHYTILMICLSFLLVQGLFAQKKQYKVACIGFYNFENLFDTTDDPDSWGDDEFTESGPKNWNQSLYQEKLGNLAKVVEELGKDLSPDGVAILGVAEIENRKVLEDFVKQPIIKSRNYQIIHFQSPDHRGIDVALLYQQKYFQPLESEPIKVETLRPDGDTLHTRDILWVKGILDGDTVHVSVNHWPSRSGGESVSSPLREFAASKNKEKMDLVFQENPKAKIILMGDLNDDPSSPSVKKVLNAQRKMNTTKSPLYNPMYDLYKKGIGTLAWRDAWNLFDQIIISEGLTQEDVEGYRYLKTQIHNKKYLVQKQGQYAGYPFRAFVGDRFTGGYSDHFPVYIYLVKEVN